MNTTPGEPKLWLLSLVIPGRFGRWWTAILIFITLLGAHYLANRFAGVETLFGDQQSFVLFFSVITAYIVPVFQLIITRSKLALRQLTPLLDVKIEQIADWESVLERKSVRWNLIVLACSLLAGGFHNWLLWESELTLWDLMQRPDQLLVVVSTVLIWVVMTFVIVSLITNARHFKWLAKQVEIDLLNPRALAPFASVAVVSTLAIIGAQAAFPLLMFDQDMNPLAFIPGLAATGVPMLLLFFWPVWPINRRLHQRKRAELEQLDAAISGLGRPQITDTAALLTLNARLVYRREIADAPEWPFDFSVLTRLMLYLIIPPLTWVGAALIEILIDSAL